MSKYLIVPDSFKGTMSTLDVCRIMKEMLGERFPDAEIHTIPVADGGEGSVDVFLEAVGGEKVEIPCSGPYGEKRTGFYGLIDNGKTAVIEMAAAAGLPLVGKSLHAAETSTYGVGELIMDALDRGVTKIIMGLGGSATNDGGCGAAAACGVQFLDDTGHAFVPVGNTLNKITFINKSTRDKRLEDVEIVTMCDINNPLCGPQGASVIFGPQKGATPAEVKMLDHGLNHMAIRIKEDCGIEVLRLKGSGAAGGMGAGMVAFFDSCLQMGIQTVLETCNFEDMLPGTDIVFTGEGGLDAQSLHGKVVVGVSQLAQKHEIPVIAVVGSIDNTIIPAAVAMGVTHSVTINRSGVPLEIAMKHPRSNLAHTMGLLSERIASGEELPARIHL